MSSVTQKLTQVRQSAAEWIRYSLLWKCFNPLRAWRPYSGLLQWGTELSVCLLSVLFAVAPFVDTNYIGLLEIGGAGLWLLLTLSEDSPQPYRISPVHGLLVLYWLCAGISTVLSPVKPQALNGMIELTLYLIVFALIERTFRSERWQRWIITVYLAAAFIVTLYGLRQWIFGAEALATWVDPGSSLVNTTRVYSYLGNPNLLSSYLIPAVSFSLCAMFVWQNWAPKILAGAMFLAHSICIVLTFSRGGWIALVVTLGISSGFLLYWMLPRLPKFWQTWAFPVLLGGGGALLLVAVLLVPTLRERALSIFASRKDSSNNYRINVWDAVKRMIHDHPLTGIGPGHYAFNKIYPLYQRPKFSALSAYSIYLEHLVEYGILGFTCFIAFLVTIFQQGWVSIHQSRKSSAPAGLWLIAAVSGSAGLLVQGFFDTVWYRPQVFTLWWMMVAIIASHFMPSSSYRSEEKQTEGSQSL